MPEARYAVVGADRCGPFYEARHDDPEEALRERDEQLKLPTTSSNGGSRTRLWQVIDLDRVDGSPDGADHGEVDWCDGCKARAAAVIPGGESLCPECDQRAARGES